MVITHTALGDRGGEVKGMLLRLLVDPWLLLSGRVATQTARDPFHVQ